MIYDSVIWKEELKEMTQSFRKLIDETEFSTDWYFNDEESGWSPSYKFFIDFQKYCFYSSVITRKFIESYRLSDELLATKHPIKYFEKKTAKRLTKHNFNSIEEEYNTEQEFIKDVNLSNICNLFIHSFIFNPKLIEYKIDDELPDDDLDNWVVEGVSGLYINTDYTKDKEVYFIELDFIPTLFESVYEDRVFHSTIDYVTGEMTKSRNHSVD